MPAVFDVDLKGLSQLIEDQGPGRLVCELVSNSLDEDGVTAVTITLEPEPGRPLCRVRVADDAPGGFLDLSHAYTLFAPSYKKAHAEKAGRFNMGDKLFVAAAVMTGHPATIRSTTGGVEFTESGRQRKREKTAAGSVVEAHLKMTRSQYADEVVPLLRRLLVPAGVAVTLNGERLPAREPVHTFEATLPTVLADDEGVLRARSRKTRVRVYEPLAGETPALYELGVPVVETGDRWHLDIGQKVPLNMERSNVPPAYLRTLRTLAVNAMADRLTAADANRPWVREATSDGRIETGAMTRVLDLRFGATRVTYDPSDPEANKTAVANRHTVVQGGMLNADEWANLKRTGTTPPAGQVFKTARPYSDTGDPATVLAEADWTPGMRRVAGFARFLHRHLFGVPLAVTVVTSATGFAAAYSRCNLDFFLPGVGHAFFNDFGPAETERVVDLLVHEFGHWYSGDHLDKAYYKGLTLIAAKVFALTLANPQAVTEYLNK